MKLDNFKRFVQEEKFAPWLYLIMCVIAFGLFIPFFGFYWDDWPTIFYTHNGRVAQLVNHFSYDRPFSVWGYWLIGRLGTSPIIWHVAAFLIRWAIVMAFAWSLKPLWPKQTRAIILLALIFAVYPGYYLQPSSVIFSSHLLALLFFLISLGAMGRAITYGKDSLRFSTVAVASTIVHMFTLEYFVGLELVRPLYLWFLFANNGVANRNRLKELMRSWWPYLGVAIAWVIWRLFLLNLPSEPYPLVMAEAFKANPLQGLIQLMTVAVQDNLYVLFTTWAEILPPTFFQFNSAISIFSWLVIIVSFAFIYFALTKMNANKTSTRSETHAAKAAQQGIALGILALVAGLLPVWMIGERIAQGDYNLRYILVAMFGAALIVGSLIFFLVGEQKYQVLIVSILAALVIGMHVRAANEYRLDWERQRAFYWQLYWRAPDFELNTALISFDRVTKYLGDPMTGNALNVLYPLDSNAPSVDLWNFELNRTRTVEAIQAGELLQNDYRGLTFSTGTTDDLVFYFIPEGGCLWALSPLDANNAYLPVENRELVSHSNLSNILPKPERGGFPPTHILGTEPQHEWCYYFEKAALASQEGDLGLVITLMQEAKEKGFGPNYGIEWLPLVEAYADTGDWDAATQLSQEIHRMHTRNDSMLCATWDSIARANLDDGDALAAYRQISTMAACE